MRSFWPLISSHCPTIPHSQFRFGSFAVRNFPPKALCSACQNQARRNFVAALRVLLPPFITPGGIPPLWWRKGEECHPQKRIRSNISPAESTSIVIPHPVYGAATPHRPDEEWWWKTAAKCGWEHAGEFVVATSGDWGVIVVLGSFCHRSIFARFGAVNVPKCSQRRKLLLFGGGRSSGGPQWRRMAPCGKRKIKRLVHFWVTAAHWLVPHSIREGMEERREHKSWES